jgi:hypothetical protein
MSNNKPLIAGILSMIVIYLLISFALWEITPKNWHIAFRFAYAMFSPVVSCLVYSAIKNIKNDKHQTTNGSKTN